MQTCIMSSLPRCIFRCSVLDMSLQLFFFFKLCYLIVILLLWWQINTYSLTLDQAGCLPKSVKMDNSPFSVHTLYSLLTYKINKIHMKFKFQSLHLTNKLVYRAAFYNCTTQHVFHIEHSLKRVIS